MFYCCQSKGVSVNSSQVVWKLHNSNVKLHSEASFNSSQVVWKPSSRVPTTYGSGFQFLIGSLEALVVLFGNQYTADSFQFLIGSLEASLGVAWYIGNGVSIPHRQSGSGAKMTVVLLNKETFQFLIGSLEAGFRGQTGRSGQQFQFLIGSLEAFRGRLKCCFISLVSIPHRQSGSYLGSRMAFDASISVSIPHRQSGSLVIGS